MAHITGGGINDNLPRILPQGTGVHCPRRVGRASDLQVWLQRLGGVGDEEMLRAFNMGIGMIVAVDARYESDARHAALERRAGATAIGAIVEGTKSVFACVTCACKSQRGDAGSGPALLSEGA